MEEERKIGRGERREKGIRYLPLSSTDHGYDPRYIR